MTVLVAAQADRKSKLDARWVDTVFKVGDRVLWRTQYWGLHSTRSDPCQNLVIRVRCGRKAQRMGGLHSDQQ